MKKRAATTSGTRSRSTRVSARRGSGRTLAARGGRQKVKSRASRASTSAGRRKVTARKRRATGTAKTTIDHDEIRAWTEARGGHPATVERTVKGGQHAGVLRIDFPGFSGEKSLRPISWEEWFQIFDERQLALLHQEKTASGKESRFNKLINRHD